MDVEQPKRINKKWIIAFIIAIFAGVISVITLFYKVYYSNFIRNHKVIEFLRNPSADSKLIIPALTRCGDAPFIMPTSGMIGFLWGDSFRPGHRHQGIDIFSGTNVGESPVYAACDGYLSRLPDWKSSVIIRIPSDPLQPDQQIWTYYTHLADAHGNSLIVEAFPVGSEEIFVSAGTLLGYQGNYSGKPGRPTGVHLHFSIVKDDGLGRFMNELEFKNTLDPSPYFGLMLNALENKDRIPLCEPQ
jgi:murein DD-endopeptidase MepM/ murein hydrolase activator NlpD